jgi:hypothetical protein
MLMLMVAPMIIMHRTVAWKRITVVVLRVRKTPLKDGRGRHAWNTLVLPKGWLHFFVLSKHSLVMIVVVVVVPLIPTILVSLVTKPIGRALISRLLKKDG